MCAGCVKVVIFLPAADEGPKRAIDLKYIKITVVLRKLWDQSRE